MQEKSGSGDYVAVNTSLPYQFTVTKGHMPLTARPIRAVPLVFGHVTL